METKKIQLVLICGAVISLSACTKTEPCGYRYWEEINTTISEIRLMPNCFEENLVILTGVLTEENSTYILYDSLEDFQTYDLGARIVVSVEAGFEEEVQNTLGDREFVFVSLSGRINGPGLVGELEHITQLQLQDHSPSK